MVLAHAGGLVADLLFAGPVLVLLVAVAIAKVRERRRAREEDDGAEPDARQPYAQAKGNQAEED